MTAQQKVRITAEEVTALPLLEFEVEMFGSDKTFVMSMEDLDPKTDKRYSNIATHNGRYQDKLRDKDLDAAMEFLFDAKFKGTNIDWNTYEGETETVKEANGILEELGGYESEKDYFLKDDTGRRYMRSVVNKYWSKVRAKAESAK